MRHCAALTLLVFLGLFCLSPLGAVDLFKNKYRELESHSDPVYLKRKGEAWARHGRLVGMTRKPPPQFTMELYRFDPEKPAYTFSFDGNMHIYETSFVTPGTYSVQIVAKGYSASRIRGVKIKAGADCMVNLQFGTRLYTR